MIEEHSLQALEFAKVLALVAGYAESDPGREVIRDLRPRIDREAIRGELLLVQETLAVLQSGRRLPAIECCDARPALKGLRLAGRILDPRELLTLGLALRTARRLGRFSQQIRALAPRLHALLEHLHSDRTLEERILKSIDPPGEVRDDASRTLLRLRARALAQRKALQGRLEEIRAALPEQALSPEATITLRNARYVLPLRSEARSKVRGIVHDRSRSGETVFVEPQQCVELGNDLRETECRIEAERERILQALTATLRPHAEALESNQEILARLDALLARARFALDYGCTLPDLGEGEGMTLRGARHPLLLTREGAGRATVALDLWLLPGERTLLVTGPNAGGKTVLLKTVGLVVLLAQSGVLPPVAEGTRLQVFQEVFVDIGDEQSLEADLSTFSSHVRRLVAILEGAGPASLVLLDEVGVGTDPAEGRSLAAATLRDLTSRGALTLATTHYGELKGLALETGFVNGSLVFDERRLQPTFRFEKGTPGMSYGLVIAERLGVPKEIVGAARALLPSRELATGDLLIDLGRRRRKVQALERLLRRRSGRLQALERGAQGLVQEIRGKAESVEAERKTLLEEARREAREIFLRARGEVEEIVRGLREDRGAARPARSRLEERIRALRGLSSEKQPSRGRHGGLEVGDRVRVQGVDKEGVVAELVEGGEEVLVAIAGVRLRVEARRTSLLAAPAAVAATPPSPEEGRAWETSRGREIDLRGMTAAEAPMEIRRFLDEAVYEGLASVAVIHGKGEGVLRRAVAEILGRDPRVRSYRLGQWNEGGSGVTIVELVGE